MSLKSLFFKTMIRLFGAKGFSKMFLASSQSETYSLFCKKVYGRDLCQANMLDEEQLQQLLQTLNLNSDHDVLDLGCGIGKITEYISDTTNAKILGVDFAYGAIGAAQARVKGKEDRINFVVGNLDKLPKVVQNKYDAIIMIDSLYFVHDLDKCVGTLKTLLKPNGKLALFYSSKKRDSDKEVDLLPENKPLGKALTKSGFKFTTKDFTANEKNIWEQSIAVAHELKDSFIQEKNAELYKSRISEASKNLEWQNKNLMKRYFYVASLS